MFSNCVFVLVHFGSFYIRVFLSPLKEVKCWLVGIGDSTEGADHIGIDVLRLNYPDRILYPQSIELITKGRLWLDDWNRRSSSGELDRVRQQCCNFR